MGKTRDLKTELFKLSITKDDIEHPLLISPIIETHCHLDYLKESETPQVVKQLQSMGISKIITISVAPNNMDSAFSIAAQYENVFCSQGIHPHEAKDYTDECTQKIKERVKEDFVIAVGEIGLDYYYDNSPREAQVKVFETQMQLACDLNMPVIIHSRDADEDTIAVLKNFESKLKRKGVIHSFTSGKELAQTAMDLDFYLGFNGIITFNKAENVRDILAITPVEKVLLETDSPFLTPVPFRGRENNPVYLPFVADYAAKFKNEDPETFLKTTTKNAENLFKI